MFTQTFFSNDRAIIEVNFDKIQEQINKLIATIENEVLFGATLTENRMPLCENYIKILKNYSASLSNRSATSDSEIDCYAPVIVGIKPSVSNALLAALEIGTIFDNRKITTIAAQLIAFFKVKEKKNISNLQNAAPQIDINDNNQKYQHPKKASDEKKYLRYFKKQFDQSQNEKDKLFAELFHEYNLRKSLSY